MNWKSIWPFSRARDRTAHNVRTTAMLEALKTRADKARETATQAADQTIVKYGKNGEAFKQLERLERTLIGYDKG